jgi:hypothetical protein
MAAAPATANPDALLIALHAEHDALERQYAALYERADMTLEQECEMDRVAEPLLAAQRRLILALGSMRATTLAGLAARLRTVMLRDDYEVSPAALLASEGQNEHLLGLVLRDLAAILRAGGEA